MTLFFSHPDTPFSRRVKLSVLLRYLQLQLKTYICFCLVSKRSILLKFLFSKLSDPYKSTIAAQQPFQEQLDAQVS